MRLFPNTKLREDQCKNIVRGCFTRHQSESMKDIAQLNSQNLRGTLLRQTIKGDSQTRLTLHQGIPMPGPRNGNSVTTVKRRAGHECIVDNLLQVK